MVRRGFRDVANKKNLYYALGAIMCVLLAIYCFGGTSGSGELYNAIMGRIHQYQADNTRAEGLVQSANSTIGEVNSGIGTTNGELGNISGELGSIATEIGDSAAKSRSLTEQIRYCKQLTERNKQLTEQAESILTNAEQRAKATTK